MAKLTFEKAIQIAKEKEGYEPCRNKAHGFKSTVTYGGKTAKANFAICPIVQFYPKPTFLFHSKKDFLKFSETEFKKRG